MTKMTSDCKRTGLGLLWRWTEERATRVPVNVSDKLFPRASSPPPSKKENSSVLPENTATQHAKRK